MLRRALNLLLGTTSNRALEAAGGGRRWADVRTSRNGATDVHASAAIINARALRFSIDNPHGRRTAEAMPAAMVGTGIVPKSQHPNEIIRTRLQLEFTAWTDEADSNANTDFYGLQYQMAHDVVVLGEAVFVWVQHPLKLIPQLRRINPEQVERSNNRRLENGHYIHEGVEFDASGRKAAYWIRPGAPGEALAGLSLAPVRYPASEVIHVFRPLFPGQVRGLSWFAPVLLSAHDLAALLDAMLVRAKTAALFVGSIYDPSGAAGGFDGTQNGPTLDTTVEPGAIRVETDGSRLEWNEPPQAGDTMAFSASMLRMIAAGVGVTYEQLTGDYSQVNYSSARAALLEFRRFCEGVQHHTLCFNFAARCGSGLFNIRCLQAQFLRSIISATAPLIMP
jgi:lambda family phage portal protein